MRIFALLVAFYFGLARSLRHVLSSKANQFRGNGIEIAVFRDSYVNPVAGKTVGATVRKDVSDVSMKVVIVYTTSGSESHMDCLCKHPTLSQRTGTPLLLRNADVILYDNGGAGGVVEEGFQEQGSADRVRVDIADAETRKAIAQKCMSQFQGAKKLLYMTSKNAGYAKGAVQAMDTVMQSGELQKYDWVVHLHPDVFVVYPQPLANMLLNTTASVIAAPFKTILTDILSPGVEGLAFDFFAFRPNITDTNAFSKWAIYTKAPELYLRAEAFPNASIQNVPHRYAAKCKTWDKFGVWHIHTDLGRIDEFMRLHPSVGKMPPWKPKKHKNDDCDNYLYGLELLQ
jgi:hypothetical protein